MNIVERTRLYRGVSALLSVPGLGSASRKAGRPCRPPRRARKGSPCRQNSARRRRGERSPAAPHRQAVAAVAELAGSVVAAGGGGPRARGPRGRVQRRSQVTGCGTGSGSHRHQKCDLHGIPQQISECQQMKGGSSKRREVRLTSADDCKETGRGVTYD